MNRDTKINLYLALGWALILGSLIWTAWHLTRS